jgi:GH15 family glucan-1,4-alpha-glucosidase
VRDAAEVVLALDAVGYPEMGSRFFEWARKAQREDGHWEQRYWINGRRGPVWSRGDGGLQIDQTGSMVFAAEQHRQVLDEVAQLEFVESMWESVRLAADLLGNSLDSQTGLHSTGMDLWETYRGSFAYTNAAIYGALRAAASFADAAGQPYLAESWRQAAVSAKRGVLERLWTGRYFARGVDTAGRLDLTVDSSTLGLVEPFDLLSLNDNTERTMMESMVETLVERLGVPLSGGIAILRFEGDRYVGGSAGGVNTLWLARVLLRLALHYQFSSDPARAAAYRDRAVQAMRVVRSRATVTGLLPELIGRADTESGWAAPHGWCMAAFIQCVRLLDRYEGTTAIPTRGAA